MTTYKELKATLKAEMKDRHKTGHSGLATSSYIDLRAMHIAYSMFKGKTLAQIESKRRDPRCWFLPAIDKKAATLLASYREQCAEDIAAYEARKEARQQKEVTQDV